MLVYYYCILAVLLIGLVCTLIIHLAHRKEGSESVGAAARHLGGKLKALKRTGKGAAEGHSHGKLAWAKRDNELRLARELHSVRTPWGWPKPSAEKSILNLNLSDAVQSFSDRLVRQKKQLESRTDKPHAKARGKENFRALIEDRYVPSTWNSPNEIQYRKVKPPRLRDPQAPLDQMDDFGIKQAELTRKKLQRAVTINADEAVTPKQGAKQDEFRYVGLKDVKQPWGW
jgi:hypothetical protein